MSVPLPSSAARPDVYVFFALACAITWLLDLPLVLAWTRHAEPPPYALAMAGLSAWGPTMAAVLVASRRGEVRGIFGPWRTSAGWILLALALPFLLHLPATVLEVALGGAPAQWFYPPVKAEHVAALVMFSLGEELGWRGYAYPRMAARHGPVVGSLVLGAAWGLWHLMMLFTPDGAAPTPLTLGKAILELALWSVVIAWIFERGHRSLLVAFAIHAGGHLDNVNRAPLDEVRLQALRLAVLAIAAVLAARALARRAA
jgi:membrane protease YdiL (CAAX protease family)